MLAAFSYKCPCGRPFVVGVDDEKRVDGWMMVMGDVAAKLGAHVVDAAEPGFSCPDCGARHVRATSRSGTLRRGPRHLRPVPQMS